MLAACYWTEKTQMKAKTNTKHSINENKVYRRSDTQTKSCHYSMNQTAHICKTPNWFYRCCMCYMCVCVVLVKLENGPSLILMVADFVVANLRFTRILDFFHFIPFISNWYHLFFFYYSRVIVIFFFSRFSPDRFETEKTVQRGKETNVRRKERVNQIWCLLINLLILWSRPRKHLS